MINLKTCKNIIFLDNTNNINFELAYFWSKLGYACNLVLFQPGILHDPKYIDSFFKFRKNIKIYDLRVFYDEAIVQRTDSFLTKFIPIVRDADLAIVNGIGINLAHYLACPFFIKSSGSDIHYWTDIELSSIRSKSWAEDFRVSADGLKAIKAIDEFSAKGRNSLLNASGFIVHPPGYFPETDELIKQLSILQKRKIDTISNPPMLFPFKKFKFPFFTNKTPIFLNGARLDISEQPSYKDLSLDHKGTDNLLRAIRLLAEDNLKFKVILFKKSINLGFTLKKIADYGIGRHIIWKNTFTYRNFCLLIQSNKIFCVIDSVGSSTIGKVSLIAYFSKKMIIGNSPDNTWKLRFNLESQNPVLHASSVEEVYKVMRDLILNKEKYRSKSNLLRISSTLLKKNEVKKAKDHLNWALSIAKYL